MLEREIARGEGGRRKREIEGEIDNKGKWDPYKKE